MSTHPTTQRQLSPIVALVDAETIAALAELSRDVPQSNETQAAMRANGWAFRDLIAGSLIKIAVYDAIEQQKLAMAEIQGKKVTR